MALNSVSCLSKFAAWCLPACVLAGWSPAIGAAPAATRGVTTTTASLPALGAPASIELDGVDIPTIRAASIDDAVRAEGWIHARERFMQMDLARRQAAGEVGQLVPAGVAIDRQMRPLGLRVVAQRALAQLDAGHRQLLEAYAEGVNAQLAASQPLEYRMLRTAPEPWRPEDSLLVQLGMARFLDSSAEFDLSRAAMYARMSPAVAGFLGSSAGPLSMSVDGSALPAAPALPSAAELDLRTASRSPRAALDHHTPASLPRETVFGSNAFAIAGSRTKDGRAIVANDMHLMLTAPGVWYRVVLEWPDAGSTRRAVGLSLPGVPLIVQGTNDSVAWGFTNLTADLSDLIVIEPDPKDAARYLVDGVSEPFEIEVVRLGKAPRDESLEIRRTRFGPVVGALPDGRPLAIRWVFLDPAATDCALFDLCGATTLDDALSVARRWHGPPQNILVAARDGRIGWTIAGSLPNRAAATPAPLPSALAPAWNGLLPAESKPIVIDPASGILTSGNQLAIAPSEAVRSVLGQDEASGDRAFRLREILAGRTDWTESELHAVQLDTRSPRLVRWRDALLAALPPKLDDAVATAARETLASWNGKVDTDSTQPEILDALRRELRKAVGESLGADVVAGVQDEALLRMLESRAPHLAPDPDGDWTRVSARALVAAAGATRVVKIDRQNPAAGPEAAVPIDFRTRGSVNIAAIRHPAADSLGAAAKVAEMPRAQLPGHPTCVRVQTPSFGASERSVVCPAHLSDAILVTPCGQASMPTSPHFRDLHGYWQRGEAYPLMPADAMRRVELVREVVPAKTDDASRERR